MGSLEDLTLPENLSAWTLASDQSLLMHMDRISKRNLARVSSVNDQLTKAGEHIAAVHVKLANTFNSFHMLSHEQFIESRVLPSEVDPYPSKSVWEQDDLTEYPASSSDPVKHFSHAFALGCRALEYYNPSSNTTPLVAREMQTSRASSSSVDTLPIAEHNYNTTPLPYIIGTREFIDYPDLGLVPPSATTHVADLTSVRDASASPTRERSGPAATTSPESPISPLLAQIRSAAGRVDSDDADEDLFKAEEPDEPLFAPVLHRRKSSTGSLFADLDNEDDDLFSGKPSAFAASSDSLFGESKSKLASKVPKTATALFSDDDDDDEVLFAPQKPVKDETPVLDPTKMLPTARRASITKPFISPDDISPPITPSADLDVKPLRMFEEEADVGSNQKTDRKAMLFSESDSDDELFSVRPKKPTAIHSPKPPSPEQPVFTPASPESPKIPKPEKDLFDPVPKPTEPVVIAAPTTRTSIASLFSDEDDELFAPKPKDEPMASTKPNIAPKSRLFSDTEDDEDMFAKPQVSTVFKPKGSHRALFSDSEDESVLSRPSFTASAPLPPMGVSGSKSDVEQAEPNPVDEPEKVLFDPVPKPTEPVVIAGPTTRTSIASMFSDEDDELFAPKPKVQPMASTKPNIAPKSRLFNDTEDDEDLFAKPQVSTVFKPKGSHRALFSDSEDESVLSRPSITASAPIPPMGVNGSKSDVEQTEPTPVDDTASEISTESKKSVDAEPQPDETEEVLRKPSLFETSDDEDIVFFSKPSEVSDATSVPEDAPSIENVTSEVAEEPLKTNPFTPMIIKPAVSFTDSASGAPPVPDVDVKREEVLHATLDRPVQKGKKSRRSIKSKILKPNVASTDKQKTDRKSKLFSGSDIDDELFPVRPKKPTGIHSPKPPSPEQPVFTPASHESPKIPKPEKVLVDPVPKPTEPVVIAAPTTRTSIASLFSDEDDELFAPKPKVEPMASTKPNIAPKSRLFSDTEDDDDMFAKPQISTVFKPKGSHRALFSDSEDESGLSRSSITASAPLPPMGVSGSKSDVEQTEPNPVDEPLV